MAKEKLDWTNIEDDSIPPKIKKMYAEAKDMQDKADAELAKLIAKKVDFDPETQEIKIGHLWGKTGFAIASRRAGAERKSIRL